MRYILISYSSQYETTETVTEQHLYEGVQGGMLVFIFERTMNLQERHSNS